LKAFFDTNVILDVLLHRAPHYQDSVLVWTLAEKGQVEGYISATSFTNIFYVVRKLIDVATAGIAVRSLRGAFHVATCDERVILQALDSGLPDFEDAVQFFSAVGAGASCIITRNQEHFPKGDLPVLSPSEFLAAHGDSLGPP
jgi:predicted nucleic acid-binding protein